MALKQVVVLFLAMFVLTDHKSVAGQMCVAGCIGGFKSLDSLIQCLVNCGTPCPIKCINDFTSPKQDVTDLILCVAGCLSPFGTIPHEVETLNPTTVCNVGCSVGICSKYLKDNNNDKYGTCMTSCSENYCTSGNIALEKA